MSVQRKIILIEDDAVDLKSLQREISKIIQKNQLRDVVVDSFSSSTDAVAYIKNSLEVSLVVCDTFIPDMDAIEILSDLSADHVQAPILLVSGVNEELMKATEYMGNSLGQNVVGSMSKPINQGQFEPIFEKVGLI